MIVGGALCYESVCYLLSLFWKCKGRISSQAGLNVGMTGQSIGMTCQTIKKEVKPRYIRILFFYFENILTSRCY